MNEDLARIGVAAAIAGIMSVFPVTASGQTHTTPWGDPDLQGVWDYWTFTPLERPDEFAGKDVLTDEEAAQVAEQGRSAALASDRDGPGAGSTGASRRLRLTTHPLLGW